VSGPDVNIENDFNYGDIIDIGIMLAALILACVLAIVLAGAVIGFVWFLLFHSAQLFGFAEPGSFLDHLDRVKKHV
jgi:hypothetical protein